MHSWRPPPPLYTSPPLSPSTPGVPAPGQGPQDPPSLGTPPSLPTLTPAPVVHQSLHHLLHFKALNRPCHWPPHPHFQTFPHLPLTRTSTTHSQPQPHLSFTRTSTTCSSCCRAAASAAALIAPTYLSIMDREEECVCAYVCKCVCACACACVCVHACS